MLKKITKIGFILLLAVVVFSNGCSKKDEIAFKKAEENYNSGKVAEAKELYTQFIKDFPTSQWRQTAEIQLKKCNDIYELLIEAIRYQNAKLFGPAQANYYKINNINSKLIDISRVDAVLSLWEWWGRQKERLFWEKFYWINACIFVNLVDYVSKIYVSNADQIINHKTTSPDTVKIVSMEELLCYENFVDDLYNQLLISGEVLRTLLSSDFRQFIEKATALYRDFSWLKSNYVLFKGSDDKEQLSQTIESIKQELFLKNQKLQKDLLSLSYFHLIDRRLKIQLEDLYRKAGIYYHFE